MRRELTEGQSLTPQVVNALQELGADMNPPLYEAGIDMEAVTRFFEAQPEDAEVTFSYNGVEVTVTNQELVLNQLKPA